MYTETEEGRSGYEQDRLLLRRYVEQNSQAAFAALVRRHIGMVYATCLREVGNAELAQDAALSVFLLLFRKASGLRHGAALASWLFQTARLASCDALRQERRRMQHEQRAIEEQQRQQEQWETDSALWLQIEPHLNAVLDRMKSVEREAVLLRCLEGLSLKEVGQALGLSEDAARMRVNRGLDKLRRHLVRLGFTVTTAALSTILTRHAAHAAAYLPSLLQSWPGPATPGQLGTFPLRSVRLSKGVQRTMQIIRLRTAAFVTLSATLIVGGIFLVRTRAMPFRLAPHPAPVLHAVQAGNPPDNGVTPAFLSNATLPDNFTLTFHVTDRDVRSPQRLAQDRERMKNSYDIMVGNGEMTRQQADKQFQFSIDGLRLKPETQYDLTFSGRNGKLLMMTDHVTAHNGSVLTAYLYDGQNSLTFYRRDTGDQADIYPGPHLWMAGWEFPLPGVGCSLAPLLKIAPGTPEPNISSKTAGQTVTVEGKVPGLSYLNGAYATFYPLYFPGQLLLKKSGGTNERKLQVTQMQLYMGVPRQLIETWDYEKPQEFQGLSLATRTRRTIRSLASAGKPERIIEFQLLSASDKPVAEERFMLERWLNPGTLVLPFDGRSGTIPSFTYDASKGSWQQQAEQVRQQHLH